MQLSNTNGEYKWNQMTRIAIIKVFLIYIAFTYKDSDLSGNVYIMKENRDISQQNMDKFLQNFANTKIRNQDITNIFVDLDLDISKNSTINSGNFNYIYSKPYYVICSDLSGQIVFGSVPYDMIW